MSNAADHARALLSARGLRPQKRLGQNFLMDGGAARRIARLAVAELPDAARPLSDAQRSGADARPPRILEIGAGTGTLTRALMDEGARVTAIEIDSNLIAILRERTDLGNAAIVAADALTFDYSAYAGMSPWRMAGNLPYNVATPLLLRLIEMHDGPEAIVAMIQKDVADRLTARPATPSYGSLSVAVQYAMDVERALTLGPRAFFPPPKVDSTVVRLTRRKHAAVTPLDETLFLQVVRAAFAYRRKTLANSLSLALDLPRGAAAAAIATCDLPPEIRGEQLDLPAFARLADALAEGRI